jgi:nucleolin
MAQSSDSVLNQIFLRNIAYKTDVQTLRTAFGKFGTVTSARIITERRYGEERSLGFGFIDFSTPEAATAAVDAPSPVVVDGRTLTIRRARPRVQRKRDTIFVSSIPEGTTDNDLKNYFAKYNPISVRIVRTNSKDSRGFAFVQFDTEEHQTAAHDENRVFQFRGEESHVQFARRAQGVRRQWGRPRSPGRATRASPAEGGATKPAADARRSGGRGRGRRPGGPRQGGTSSDPKPTG